VRSNGRNREWSELHGSSQQIAQKSQKKNDEEEEQTKKPPSSSSLSSDKDPEFKLQPNRSNK
jgi:hypothetical protein